jgi:cell division protein FtsW
MWGAGHFPYWKWRALSTIGVLGCIIALVAVYAPHIGMSVHGSHRWIGHAPIRIQPSEFAKLFIVLFIARSCAGNVRIMKHFVTGPGPGILATVVLALLTAKEPDLGTALLITSIGIATLFFAGMKLKHLGIILAVAIVMIGGLVAVKFMHSSGSYQRDRILIFLHPDSDKEGDGFQVYHSTLALGSGGLTGLGIGQGREKLNLPEAHTDFIFAVIAEEGGLIGSLVILGLLSCVVARGMHIACNTRDRFGSLLAAGISFGIGIQTFANIAVVTASMPNTGVPLPFISYGGSSLLLSLLMVGILLNIGRYPDGDPTAMRNTKDKKAEQDYNRRWHWSSGVPQSDRRRSSSTYKNPAAN